MNSWLLTCFILFLVMITKAQTPSLFLLSKDTTYQSCQYMPFVEADGFYDNNAVDHVFINKLYRGGYISEGLVDEQLNRMNTRNRAGMHGSLSIGAMNFGDSLFGQNKIGMFIRLQTVYDASFEYSKDIFHLIFRGNLSTADQGQSSGTVHGIYQSYQKFGVGFFDKKTLSSISLSLVAGDSYYKSNISTAWSTNSINDEIAYRIGGDFIRTDTSKKGFGVGNGIGVATDIRLNLPLTNKRGVFSFSLSDFGMVRWNKQSEKFLLNTDGVWRGFDVGNFFRDSLTWVAKNALKDSLQYIRTTAASWKMMASSAQCRLNMQMTKKGFLEGIVCVRINQAFRPLLSVGWTQMIHQHLSLTARILHGGFSGVKAGCEVQWMPGGKLFVSLGSNHLAGFVSRSSTGQGVYLMLTKMFFTPKDHV